LAHRQHIQMPTICATSPTVQLIPQQKQNMGDVETPLMADLCGGEETMNAPTVETVPARSRWQCTFLCGSNCIRSALSSCKTALWATCGRVRMCCSGNVNEDNSTLLNLVAFSSNDAVAGGLAIQFPPTVDMLPSVVDIMSCVVEAKRSQARLFCRGSEQGMYGFEADHAVLRQFTLELTAGVTYQDKIKKLWYAFWNKSVLIQTIQAVENMSAKAAAISAGELHVLLQEEQSNYYRQGIGGTLDACDVHASTSVKLTSLLMLQLLLVKGGRVPVCFTKPPPDHLINRLSLTMDELDELDVKYDLFTEKADMDAVLPFHPLWFQHNVPLLLGPWFSQLLLWLERKTKEPHLFMDKVNAHRQLLALILGELKTQLDYVHTMLVKIMGAFAAAWMFVYHHAGAQMGDEIVEWFNSSNGSLYNMTF